MPRRDRRLVISTPEGVRFTLTLGGPVIRFLAWSLDFFCVMALFSAVQSLLKGVAVIAPDIATAVAIFVYFVLSVGYGMALEWWWRGQTVGKRLLRLRVMDEGGLKLKPSQVVVRNLLRAVDALPLLYLVGGLSSILDRNCRRLGDMAAGTVVTRVPDRELPDLSRLEPDKYNSLREHPLLVSRLRSKVTPEEGLIACRALLRRDRLDPVARVELFRRLADHFRSIERFPQEALEGVSDERLVRNIVEVVYEKR